MMFDQKFILTLLLSIFCQLITSPIYAEENFNSWYESLSDKQKVSQLFITGLSGQKLSNKEKMTFTKWPISGVIYFKRNFKDELQFKSLNNEVMSLFKEPLLTFTDQEGGDVSRFGNRYDNPTALSVGSVGNKKLTKYLGVTNGSLLNNYEISSNLAPVVDIKHPILTDFISNRSYGSDAKLVSLNSLEYSKGLLSNGILPTLKHFPGLGGIEEDNHKKTTVKKSKKQVLLERDWLPYKTHQNANIPFLVMTSHTHLYVDGVNYGNTTYSKRTLNELRKITNSNLVVMTDDLQMSGAFVDGLSFKEAAYKSFMAGHDLLLIAWSGTNLKNSLTYFEKKLQTDKDFQERLKTSLYRIYRIKKIALRLKKRQPSLSILKSLQLSSKINSKISNLLLSRSLNKNDTKTLNQNDLSNFLIFSSDTLFKKPLNSKVKTYSLVNTSKEDIIKLCKDKSCILHLTGQKTFKKINEILFLSKRDSNTEVSSSDRKLAQSNSLQTKSPNNKIKFTVINSVDPNFISQKDRARHTVLDVMTRSYKLGDQILSLLTGDDN